MLDSVYAGSGSSAVARAPAQVPSRDPAEQASRILEVGSRWGRDDYDARLDALADGLQNGDPLYREQLMAELFRQDPNALGSWLQPDRANRLQDAGRITLEQKGLLAEGLAAAWNNGDIPHGEIGVGQVPGSTEMGTVDMSALENRVLSGFFTPGGLGAGPDTVGNAQRMREFTEFFDASNGPEVAQFRESFGKHLIDQYVLNPAVGYHNPSQRDAAALWAGNLLGGDLSRPEIATNVLQQYDGDQVRSLIDAAARAHGALGEDGIRGQAEARLLDPRDVAVHDGAALLIGAVNLADTPASDALAVEIARMAQSHPGVFAGDAGQARLDSLTLLATRHSEAVLGALTAFDTTGLQGRGDTNNMQFKVNATELAALLNLTVFNPDSTYAASMQAKVVDYASALADEINRPGSNTEAIGHLAMLQASLSDAITQGYDKLLADEAAGKKVMEFVVDLALAALPVGKWTSGAVEKALADAFAHSPRVQEVLKGLSGHVIDSATGALTDQAKKAIVDALGEEEGGLAIARETVNGLNQQFAAQITDEADKTDLKTTYITIYEAITQ